MASYGALNVTEQAFELTPINVSVQIPGPLKDAVLGESDSKSRQIIENPTMREKVVPFFIHLMLHQTIINLSSILKQLQHWEKIIEGASNRAPPAIVPCLKKMAPFFSMGIVW